ncbi:MAG: hypothetical protein WAZ14_00080 [Patescibacteria group bacterium]
MTTTTLRHYQVVPDYCTPIQPKRVFISSGRREAVQQVARVWFNKRKLRQHARQVMDFVSLPSQITLKYKLR